LSLPISRAKFEELNLDLFKRTLAPVAQVGTEGGKEGREGGLFCLSRATFEELNVEHFKRTLAPVAPVERKSRREGGRAYQNGLVE